MTATKVLFIWQPSERLKHYLSEGLKSVADLDLIFPPDSEPKTMLRLAPDADAIVGWRPTPELLAAAIRLRLFINPGAGVQHLLDMFRELDHKRQVTLVNGHGNSYFTAQHTVALLLALTNKIIPHHRWLAEGKWRMGDSEASSMPLRDRVVGLLGYGHVNRLVHRFLAPYEVEFAALRRNWSKLTDKPPTELKRFQDSELHDFLRGVDILIISLPQTIESTGMIGVAELRLLGENSLLVNVGRGPVVDEDALYRALKERTIAGAAIDVWYEYRPEPNRDGRKYPFHHPFDELDNVVLSPHRAASPFDDLRRWDEVIENIKRLATGESRFLNIVDLTAGY
jgi:phosphoglycerate dehydrogenase-like enzyme